MVFDFDGVLVDSEPMHLAAFQHVLEPLGVRLTRDAYYEKYLGFDDNDCFIAVLTDGGVAFDDSRIADLISAKAKILEEQLGESVPLPGSVELIEEGFRRHIPLAICSSALRGEIELACGKFAVLDKLTAIVGSEDVTRSKPDPQCYRLVLERLTEITGSAIEPTRTIAVEDSPFGIDAAKGACMKTLAVTNSYPPDRLQSADRIVDSLREVTIDSLEELLQELSV